ncbi:MAG TPA: ferritin [Acidobacteriota bacterium]|nr:ferritin [Acidobacteriota bacterium]
MISKKILEAINAHIQEEMYSSNLYLSMAAYCESVNLKGFAHWMRIQANEEHGHAMKLFEHLVDRGGKPQIKGINEPPAGFESPRDVFEKTLAHEREVTKKVHKLYEVALEEKDYAAQILLQWFISEQVEEEARVTETLEKLKSISEGSSAIFWVDKELRKRAG